jgi:hypothetical protein
LIIDGERFVALGASMGKALSALATVATIGAVAAIESDFWPIDSVGSAESVRSLIDGMMLGSNVWHYNPSLAAAYTNATLITLSSSVDLNSVLSGGGQED